MIYRILHNKSVPIRGIPVCYLILLCIFFWHVITFFWGFHFGRHIVIPNHWIEVFPSNFDILENRGKILEISWNYPWILSPEFRGHPVILSWNYSYARTTLWLLFYLFLQALDREREKIHFDKSEKKRIDYVLVYTATDEKEEKKAKRLEFEKNLEMEGLELEHEHEDVRNWNCFILNVFFFSVFWMNVA